MNHGRIGSVLSAVSFLKVNNLH